MRKLALIFSHPTQFEAPLFRLLAKQSDPPVEIFFWNTDRSAEIIDPELGHAPVWDVPLTEGYTYHLIPRAGRWNYLREAIFQNPDFLAALISGYSERPAQLALLQATLFGKPSVLRSDSVSIYSRSVLKQILRKPSLYALFSCISAFMATGSLAAEHLIQTGARKESVFFLPYAVDGEALKRKCDELRENRAVLRSELGVEDAEIVILAILKFIPREGIMDLLKAYAALADKHRELRLVIVGSGPLKQQVDDFVANNNLSGVHLAGYQPYSQLPKFYAISDLFIHPAINEPWGVSVNEAMSCSLPVIVSNLTGSYKDLVRDGCNGFIFSGGSPDELTKAIEKFLNVYGERQRLGSASYDLIQNWGYERCINEIKRLMVYLEEQ